MSSTKKYSDLDSLLTKFLKACLDRLLYPIANTINASLCSGLFPDDFKQEQVNPFLNKSTLSKGKINKRISNVSSISKVLESCCKPSKVSH